MSFFLSCIAGSNHNLDLNLGISTPSSENSPKENESSWSPQIYSYDALEAGRLKVILIHIDIYTLL